VSGRKTALSVARIFNSRKGQLSKKKKGSEKVTWQKVLKWFLIAIGCIILLLATIDRVHHYFTVHLK
tara:strand:+ start:242 stop:442 length:201 start_codon:yes stop_codon:yes gene_type:complete